MIAKSLLLQEHTRRWSDYWLTREQLLRDHGVRMVLSREAVSLFRGQRCMAEFTKESIPTDLDVFITQLLKGH